MSAKSEKILRDFTKALTTPKGTSAYDTQATVLRVEGNTAWVHIPGGVDETPVKMTIDAKAGDVVQVRVSGGRAFLVGNATAPPTDDAEAIAAKVKAEIADENAKIADIKADEAMEIAGKITQHFWTNEDGAHITQITQEGYLSNPSIAGPNTLVDSEGMKVKDGETVKALFGTMTRIGEENKSRVEITDSEFRQVTDSNVAAMDVISSGSTAMDTITSSVKRIKQPFRRGNIPYRFVARTVTTKIGEYDSSISPITVKVSKLYFENESPQYVTKTISYPSSNDLYTEVSVYTQTIKDELNNNISITVRLLWWNDNLPEGYETENNALEIRCDYSSNADALYFHETYPNAEYSYSYQQEIEIPSIELNGEIIFKRPNDVFVVEQHETGTLTGNGAHDDEYITITKTGYYPVGIVGYEETGTLTSFLHLYATFITDATIGSGKIRFNRRVTGYSGSTTLSGKVIFSVLWVNAE